MARLEWHGEEFKAKVHEAEAIGLRETLAAAAARARASHPGWKNETGKTEASIGVIGTVRRDARGFVGRFGSTLRHFVFLEIGSRGRAGDHTLRRALDVEGGHLPERIAGGLTGRIGGSGSIGRASDAHTDTSGAAAAARASDRAQVAAREGVDG